MDSYIVRIYRRDERGTSPVRGVVEKVGGAEQVSFGTKEELWQLLSCIKQRRLAPAKKKRERHDEYNRDG